MADEARSRLGRGLASLIGDVGGEAAHVDRPRNQRKVPIEFLKPNPRNPRRTFSDAELAELADFDQAAWRDPADRGAAGARARTDRFEIIAGERRWRAAQRAGLHEVPIVPVDVTDSRRARNRDHRKRPARRPQRDRRGAGLSRARRRIQTQPGRHRQDRRQEPQPRRQHDAADEAAGGSAGVHRQGRTVGRPCACADRRARSAGGRQAHRRGGPQRSSDRSARA